MCFLMEDIYCYGCDILIAKGGVFLHCNFKICTEKTMIPSPSTPPASDEERNRPPECDSCMANKRSKLIRVHEMAVTEYNVTKAHWHESHAQPTSVQVVAEKYNAYISARRQKRKRLLDILDSDYNPPQSIYEYYIKRSLPMKRRQLNSCWRGDERTIEEHMAAAAGN